MTGIMPLVASDKEMWMREFDVDADTATAMFKNDPTKLDTDGNVSVMTSASDNYIGPALAIKNSSGVELTYLPASTAGKALVATNPDMRVKIKAAAAAAKTAVGSQADLDFGAGSTSTGVSGMKLATGSLAAAGSCAQFIILDKIDYVGNDWGDSDVELECIAAEHALKSTRVAI